MPVSVYAKLHKFFEELKARDDRLCVAVESVMEQYLWSYKRAVGANAESALSWGTDNLDRILDALIMLFALGFITEEESMKYSGIINEEITKMIERKRELARKGE